MGGIKRLRSSSTRCGRCNPYSMFSSWICVSNISGDTGRVGGGGTRIGVSGKTKIGGGGGTRIGGGGGTRTRFRSSPLFRKMLRRSPPPPLSPASSTKATSSRPAIPGATPSPAPPLSRVSCPPSCVGREK